MTRELPNNTPYIAKVSLIKDFQKEWPKCTNAVVEGIHKLLKATGVRLIHETFGPFNHLEPKVK